MRYFRPFEIIFFFCSKNENISYTKCPILTRPAKKKNNSCMLRIPMFKISIRVTPVPPPTISQIFPQTW